MFNVLVVEDDKNLKRLIVDNLKDNNYDTYEATDGEKALEVLETNYIDIIITDIMMPNMDGFELIKELRRAEYNMPILVITAKSELSDKKQGFFLGADDYLVKPFNIEELLIRVEALLRRADMTSQRKITVGDFEIDYDKMTVKRKNKAYNLANKEFQLLYKFLSKPDTIFTRQDLIEEIWGLDSDSDYRTVDVHIKRIREKLDDVKEFEIVAIRGVGYKCVLKKKG